MTIRLSAGHPVYREQWIETSRSSMPTQSGIPPHLHDQRQANRKTVRMDENYSADCARPVLRPRSGSLVLGAPNNCLHLQAAGGTFSNSLLEKLCSITDASTRVVTTRSSLLMQLATSRRVPLMADSVAKVA